MRYCTGCCQQIPLDVEAVLTGVIEQGSGPGIPQYRHPGCKPRPAGPGADRPPQVGIRRAP
ncbi:hypothetical protein [Streptomyces sp. IBSBF 2435]|uniref:hypothetical protein n=1 Tax=Streptomyces sp. IBSBF 2435 TaxID=2903531 RepID=UPI002FDBEDEB